MLWGYQAIYHITPNVTKALLDCFSQFVCVSACLLVWLGNFFGSCGSLFSHGKSTVDHLNFEDIVPLVCFLFPLCFVMLVLIPLGHAFYWFIARCPTHASSEWLMGFMPSIAKVDYISFGFNTAINCYVIKSFTGISADYHHFFFKWIFNILLDRRILRIIC